MRRIEKDFVTLFNVLWYRDFPLSQNHKKSGSRAEWTTHIGVCIRTCADLLGRFTYFEQGNRTDAIIKDNKNNDIAHIEWEWTQPFNEKVNEISKLYNYRNKADFSVFIGYSNVQNLNKCKISIEKQWRSCSDKLLVFLITYKRSGKKRDFEQLISYELKRGKLHKIRFQDALPWRVSGSRWEERDIKTSD